MLYKGNNKFKTLHKGNELVTRVFKGDELIYQDIEALYSFKFTINTKKNTNGAETNTNKTLQVGFKNAQDTTVPFAPVLVDWGDGQSENIVYSSGTSASATHTYAEAGTYQVNLLPTVFENGYPKEGWLSGFFIGDSNKVQVVSFDKALPEGSFIMSLQGGQRNTMTFRNTLNPISFEEMRNLVHVPANFYSNAIFRSGDVTKSSMSNRFTAIGKSCGYNINPADKDYNVMSVLKVLIDKLDTSGIKDFTGAFGSTFRDSNSETIPAGLFDALDTSSATNLASMFNNTFFQACTKSTTGTIPAHLFDSITTSTATSVSSMFYYTFYSTFGNGELNTSGCTVTELPANLLPLDYSSATSASSLFNGTFMVVAPRSTALAIPDHFFDGLKIPLATDYTSLFYNTFGGFVCSNAGIPEHLFDNVTLNPNATNFYQMFCGTFYRLGWFYHVQTPPTSTNTIPAGLFDFVDTSSGTNFSQMFQYTFGDSLYHSTTATIPAGLFDFLDMTHATNITEMFYRTFEHYGYDSTVATIPSGLFAHLNTSSCTGFTRLFGNTFSGYGASSLTAQIPSGIFSALNMTSCTNAQGVFSNTFSRVGQSNTTATIPSDLFSTVNVYNATTVANLFDGTFYSYGAANTNGVIPAGLFSNIASPNATTMSAMFQYTFNGAFGESTVVTIPSDIFSALDMTKAKSVNGMFMSTFASFGNKSQSLTIPATLFANVNFSLVTNFTEVFRQTFENSFANGGAGSTNPVVVPATLFQNVDTTSATNTKHMFLDTFHGAAIAAIPQGIFGHIKVPASHDRMFGECFGASNRYSQSGYQSPVPLNDPFDGMTDFSWASASETVNQSAIWAMFRSYDSSSYPDINRLSYTPTLTGSASTVLQHFNFTPNVRLETFENQKLLTDYSTIANNWK